MIKSILCKAFNGKFPNAKATIIDFEITPKRNAAELITKEIALKCFTQNLDSHNVIKRLFHKQLGGEEAFEEANDIIWFLEQTENSCKLTTSEYFMSKEEFINKEFEVKINFFEEN